MSNNSEKKLNGTVIVTYRCNARCSMCNRYKAPSKPEEEISIETIKKLPKMYFTNITGGEPFIRNDLKDIVRELYKKSDRIVISTNGFFTDRIVDLCKEFPQIGIRISIEGLEQTNNEIRGLQNGYQRGYSTLKKLREMGMKDVGFGMTVQDKNASDLVPLYKISDEMGMEFATASLHNSFYFVEAKNIIHNRPTVAKNFENLVNELLRSNSPKKWFRAYFNHGLINYIYGQKRLLPCDMSFDTFFIDPYGDVMPCNGTKDKEVMIFNRSLVYFTLKNYPKINCIHDSWIYRLAKCIGSDIYFDEKPLILYRQHDMNVCGMKTTILHHDLRYMLNNMFKNIFSSREHSIQNFVKELYLAKEDMTSESKYYSEIIIDYNYNIKHKFKLMFIKGFSKRKIKTRMVWIYKVIFNMI